MPRHTESFGASEYKRNPQVNVEPVDLFLLHPQKSQQLVKRLSSDPTWVTKCEEEDLVVFVRSSSENMDRKDGKL